MIRSKSYDPHPKIIPLLVLCVLHISYIFVTEIFNCWPTYLLQLDPPESYIFIKNITYCLISIVGYIVIVIYIFKKQNESIFIKSYPLVIFIGDCVNIFCRYITSHVKEVTSNLINLIDILQIFSEFITGSPISAFYIIFNSKTIAQYITLFLHFMFLVVINKKTFIPFAANNAPQSR